MVKKIISYTALLLLGACFLLPFIIMILGSFKDAQYAQMDPLFWIPDQPTLKNYIYIFRDGIFFRWIMNSVIVTIIPVISQMDYPCDKSNGLLCSIRLYICKKTVSWKRSSLLDLYGSHYDSTTTANYSKVYYVL